MQPLVTIIIPTYNRAHLIGETLDSVISQTYADWECIVVDDLSNDYTDELLEFYCELDSRFRFYKRPKNSPKGANACRNYGFKLSWGKYVNWFDSDDSMAPEFLKSRIKIIESNSDVDFVFSDYMVYEGTIGNIIHKQKNCSDNPIKDYFSGSINLATPSVLWNRKAIEGNKFDERLHKTQELDFIFQLSKNKKLPLKGHYSDFNGLFIRRHDQSIVSSFHRLEPRFLLSDVWVRNEICNYYKNINSDILLINQSHLYKSLKGFIKKSSVRENLAVFKIIKSRERKLTRIKLEILLFKIVFRMFNRDHRLGTSVKVLSKDFFFEKSPV